MSGALNMSFAMPLLVSPPNRSSVPTTPGSDRKVSFGGWTCEAASHAVAETAPPASLYEVLRVRHNATAGEIKKAYRSLAKLCHPDSAGAEADGRDFIEIQKAYATLSDPVARDVYDESLRCASRRRSLAYSGGHRTGFRRSWETDQCW